MNFIGFFHFTNPINSFNLTVLDLSFIFEKKERKFIANKSWNKLSFMSMKIRRKVSVPWNIFKVYFV